MAIYRVCYCTREEVKRALDVKQAAYNDAQVDRQIQNASDSVDGLCMRVFYPADDTRTFDWPNFQFAYPWQLWLDNNELAVSPATKIVTGTFLTTPIVIPSTAYILRPSAQQPPSMGPPFRLLELRRDSNSGFGANTTPQLDIGITGTFGYWNNLLSSPNSLSSGINASQTQFIVNIPSGADGCPGIGDMIVIDSERMIVVGAQYTGTGLNAVSGLTSSPPSMADNQVGVGSGSSWNVGDDLLVDAEILHVNYINGNTLIVARAWDGSVLATHSPPVQILTRSQLTVIRGALGTTAATHSINAPISFLAIPGLVKELAVAEALVGLTQEPGAYAYATATTGRGDNILGGTGHGQQREPVPGAGLPDVRDRCFRSYGVKVRSRVV